MSNLSFNPRKYLRPNLTEAMVVDIKRAFDYVDKDHDGYISKKE